VDYRTGATGIHNGEFALGALRLFNVWTVEERREAKTIEIVEFNFLFICLQ
jgi:hypothetical protein